MQRNDAGREHLGLVRAWAPQDGAWAALVSYATDNGSGVRLTQEWLTAEAETDSARMTAPGVKSRIDISATVPHGVILSDVPLLVPLSLMLALAGFSLWVLSDARSNTARGKPVTAQVGNVVIDRPEVWAVLCLCLSIFGVPLYLTARKY